MISNSAKKEPLARFLLMRLRGLEPMYTIKNAGKERFSARHPLAVPMVVPRSGKPDFGDINGKDRYAYRSCIIQCIRGEVLKMLTKIMMQVVRDLKLQGYSMNEIAGHYQNKEIRPPSPLTIKKYYLMDVIPNDPGKNLENPRAFVPS